MKRTIKLAVVAALAMGATSAFATNGDNLIALGAKARGMGGTGIGVAHGAESGLANPALIKESEVTFGGTYFAPDVKFNNASVTPDPTGARPTMTSGIAPMQSKANKSVIPEVAVSIKVNDMFTWGVGMYGVAGMGTDYRDDIAVFSNGAGQYPSPSGNQSQYQGTMSGTNQLSTNLQLMRFAVPLAFHTDSGLSLAVSPILQYGSLEIAYNNGSYFNAPKINPATGAVTTTPVNVRTGSGYSQDFGFGYQLGLSYKISGLTLGAEYTSAIDMEYLHQISDATRNFGINGGLGFSDHLEQPADMGVGVSYKFGGNTVAVDYKRIKWGSAKGYQDFNWEDQNVIALGYEYAAKVWAFRIGYNYANNPIKERLAANAFMPGQYDGAAINYFNMAGFPAVEKSHYTIGGTYNISKMFGIDVAYTYAPEVTTSMDTSAMTQANVYAATYAATGGNVAQSQAAAAASSSRATVSHSQQALTLAMTIKF